MCRPAENAGAAELPTFASWRQPMADAELQEGWISVCENAGRFLALNQEMVAALAACLSALGHRPIVEVCAGNGELARALNASDVTVVATDANADVNPGVQRLVAQEALRRYQPELVLGCFVPADSGVDEAVLASRFVRHYVILNARIGGMYGASSLWNNSHWKAEPLRNISRWMVTRHDVLLSGHGDGMMESIQHGEAWHLERS
ncbi:MAG: hypothetical protein ACC628_22620, partial [Pirellulaceae bacterium]